MSDVNASPSAYFLVINGKPDGPFSLAELKVFKIKPGDFLKTAAMDDYKEAHEIAEIRELLGFSKAALTPQYFGSFDQRLLAAAIDWFFVGGACAIMAFAVTLFADNKGTRLFTAFGLLALIPIVKLVYQIIMEGSAKQATFGKQILGIKVCGMQGEKISIAHAAGRNLAKIFCVLTLFTGYLFSFFNKKQQCLHDMIAGTLVMKDRLF